MNPDIAAGLLASLLSLYHHGVRIERIRNHQSWVVSHLVEAIDAHPEVPPALLMSVGFLETGLGFDSGEGGCWGSPIDRRHRHTTGGPIAAARDLAHSYVICGGDWMPALHRYRVGLCNGHERIGYTADQAMRLRWRIEERYATEVYMRVAASPPMGP